VRLLKYTPSASISLKLSRNGVVAGMIWNSTSPIGVRITAEPKDDVVPIPNWTVTLPSEVLSIVTPGESRWKALNWESPAVERFAAPVSTIIP
jgi:hypothetical protein